MRIFLIGFMGSGKSTTGIDLAAALGFNFFDLDEIIEDREARSIADIFEKEGELYFRQLERDSLHEMVQLEKTIIATGGGTPCFFDNIEWMNHHGITVYLKLSPERLLARIKDETAHRPIVSAIEESALLGFIKTKLEERSPFYEKAHLIFNIDNENTEVVSELRQSLLKIIGH